MTDEQNTFRFIRIKELTKITGRSKSSTYADIATGRLPKPYQLGPRSVGWRSDEIENYIASLPRAGRAN